MNKIKILKKNKLKQQYCEKITKTAFNALKMLLLATKIVRMF